MLNLAGREYDFGPVLYAVLQDCEHRRRSLPDPDSDSAADSAAEIARARLAEIQPCYQEAGGTAGYWRELETEILDTALPQYARAAAAQTRLERASYGLWRQGDPVARVAMGLGGLVVGGLIVKAPFIPIFEDAFAFALAAAAFFYPEIKRLVFDWRYSRLLNRLISQAETYQHRRLPYVSEAGLEAELRAVGTTARGTASGNATCIGAVPVGATSVSAAAVDTAAAGATSAGATAAGATTVSTRPAAATAPPRSAAAPADAAAGKAALRPDAMKAH